MLVGEMIRAIRSSSQLRDSRHPQHAERQDGSLAALFFWNGFAQRSNEPTLREVNLRRFAPAVRFVSEESMDENAVELEVVRRKRGWLVIDGALS